jgi:Putative Flp pilus-assembly TadE/G-like
MLNKLQLRNRRLPSTDERGQVLLIFAFAFAIIIMFLALLFDGAQGLVLKRQLQNASDAASMAGANIVQAISPRGCSASPGPPPGAPQALVVAAVQASVAANLPGFDPADVVVTCPNGWENGAVKVQLGAESATFFGSIFGGGPLVVNSESAAVNGQSSSSRYSMVLLNPSHLSWPTGRNGCPSMLLSGGPTAQFDSAIYINSTCTAANGGALSTNGNAATLTMGNGQLIRIVGEYAPGSLTITPLPLNHQNPKPDPLAGLPTPPISSMPVRSNSRLIQNGGSIVLSPGVYRGGIELRSSAKAYLRPGIYILDGGGLSVGAQTQVYTIRASASSATQATWGTIDCPVGTCGALLYNTGTATGSPNQKMGEIKISAGAVVMLRSYNPDTDTSAFKNEEYRNLLFWQSAAPVQTSTYAQPPVQLIGGGGVEMSGTVYAPSARVDMQGTSGGGSGGTVDLTLQFIVWDLSLQGNANFHFRYSAEAFARLTDYGLIE